MSSFQTVLCALDFEPGSERALTRAADLAERSHGALHLLHVAPLFRARLAHDGGDPDARFRRRAEAFVNDALGADDAVDVLAPALHEIHGQAAADGILDHAEAIGADLVVVGTHGRSGLGLMLLGSVASEVVRRSPVPVLVVPDRAGHVAPGPDHPVVVAVDLLASTGPALEAGRVLAEAHGAELVPIHVRPVAPDTLVEIRPHAAHPHGDAAPSSRLVARAAVADAIREAGVEGLVADTYVVPGAPGPSLIEMATRARAGAIVVGTHGRTGWDRVRLGSVADWVVRHAPCPVLTVPVAPD